MLELFKTNRTSRLNLACHSVALIFVFQALTSCESSLGHFFIDKLVFVERESSGNGLFVIYQDHLKPRVSTKLIVRTEGKIIWSETPVRAADETKMQHQVDLKYCGLPDDIKTRIPSSLVGRKITGRIGERTVLFKGVGEDGQNKILYLEIVQLSRDGLKNISVTTNGE